MIAAGVALICLGALMIREATGIMVAPAVALGSLINTMGVGLVIVGVS